MLGLCFLDSKSEGNNADALYYAQVALSISPNNKDLKQYVDSLKITADPAPAETSSVAPSKKKNKTIIREWIPLEILC